MTSWFIFSVITLLIILLFGGLLWRQNKGSQKRWLINKIKTNPKQKDNYIKALNNIDKHKTHSIKTTLWLLLVLVPAALLINAYLFPPQIQQAQQPPSLEEALAHLEQSLQDNPNDLEGQLLYARAMMSMQNYTSAVKALKKANELSPNNANILTEWAEAVAFKNDTGSFLGEPESLIDRALKADPSHQKALWLKGIIAFEKNQYAQAEDLWTRLIQNISDDNVKTTIIKQINQARTQQNKAPLKQMDLNDQTDPVMNDQVAISYEVTVEADETIKNQKFPATTRIFVAAKALSGPPMPVAAIDVSPPFTWPLMITLSDQHNLTQERRLSDFEQLIISASLSISGDAGASDYESNSVTVSAQENQTTVKLMTQ